MTKGKITHGFCRAVSEREGLDFRKVLREFERNNRKYLTGKMQGKEFFDSFAGKLGIKKDYDFYRGVLLRVGRSRGPVLGLARKLKGYKTAVISDNYRELVDFIVGEYRLEEIFDVLVFSNELGIKKPDKRIFLSALKRLRVRPQEAVFIDDISRNVGAARSLGMKAIYFQGYESLKKKLANIGIRT